MIELLLQKMIK